MLSEMGVYSYLGIAVLIGVLTTIVLRAFLKKASSAKRSSSEGEKSEQTGDEADQGDSVMVSPMTGDEETEQFTFRFTVNNTFLNHSSHPLTILKQFNKTLDCHIKGDKKKIIISVSNKKLTGHIYHGIAGYGSYYQLRIRDDQFRKVVHKFNLEQVLEVEMIIYKSTIEVKLACLQEPDNSLKHKF